eukprot:3424095-Prymnesium_polylepis.1
MHLSAAVWPAHGAHGAHGATRCVWRANVCDVTLVCEKRPTTSRVWGCPIWDLHSLSADRPV